jgi:hypothetical protein
MPSVPDVCIMTDAMYGVRRDRYPTVIRELIRHENDVTNHLLIGEMKDKFDLITSDFTHVRWLGDRKGIERKRQLGTR